MPTMTAFPSHPSRSSVEQVVTRILQSGRITRQDESLLLQATTADQPLNIQELQQIRDVLNRLRMGRLKVVD